jgi:pentatricopeptide repeat protein
LQSKKIGTKDAAQDTPIVSAKTTNVNNLKHKKKTDNFSQLQQKPELMLQRITYFSRFRLLHYMGTTKISSLSFPLHSLCTKSTNINNEIQSHSNKTHFLNSMRNQCKSGKLNNIHKALNFFHIMARMNPLPSVEDFTLLLGLIVKMKHYTTAISLVKEMHFSLGIKMDTFTLNVVINSLCRLKLVAFGFSVLGTMFKLGFEPSVVTFTSLINGFCVKGDVGRAVELVDHMEKMGYRSDVKTYGVLINGLCKMGGNF